MLKGSAVSRLFALILACVFLSVFTTFAVVKASAAPRVHERPQLQPSITLQPILVPGVGTQATFTITETWHTEVAQRSGLFTISPDDETNEHVVRTIRALYTVLEPDGTGKARVQVRARAMDPQTGEFLGRDVWEAVYTITEDGAEAEAGFVPEEYEDMVTPDWLADWTLTPTKERPQGALRPGAGWQANADFAELEEFPFEDMAVPVTGVFVGWVELPAASSLTAHVSERVNGSNSIRDEISEGLSALIGYELNGSSDYWLDPRHFPHKVEQSLIGGTRVTIGPESGAPEGVTGVYQVSFHYDRRIERDSELVTDWLLPAAYPVIESGRPVQGKLGVQSLRLEDDTFADVYTFQGTANQQVAIRLESDDFDAYLFLLDQDEQALGEDDDSAGGSNALVRHTLPYTGTYYIVVNALFAEEAGSYTLSLEVIQPSKLNLPRSN